MKWSSKIAFLGAFATEFVWFTTVVPPSPKAPSAAAPQRMQRSTHPWATLRLSLTRSWFLVGSGHVGLGPTLFGIRATRRRDQSINHPQLVIGFVNMKLPMQTVSSPDEWR